MKTRIPAAILRDFQARDKAAFVAEVQAYCEAPRRIIPAHLIHFPTETRND